MGWNKPPPKAAGHPQDLTIPLVGVGGALAFQSLSGEEWGEKITFAAGEEVYYTKTVAEAEARKLGHFLQEDGYFDGKGSATVQLARVDGQIIVSFVVRPNAWKVEFPL